MVKYKIIIIFLVMVFLAACGAAFLFWQEIQEFEPDVYYYVPPEKSFVYQAEEMAGFGFEDYLQDKIKTETARLVEQKKDFIYINLKEMKMFLYKEGEVFETFTVQSKGREGSFWETAPGAYFIGDKVVNHFSTVSRVWMPYAIQFYGNFFIHGWPYYTGGRPLSTGPSGGCIRLLTADAIVVFNFAERGMPILIFEEKTSPPLPALMPIGENINLPDITGQSFIAADLTTGEIILSKEIHSEIYADVTARGMLALAVSEVISMERRIIARDWMIENVKEGIIVPGGSYRSQDLISFLLIRSSREAALVLSRFFTPDYFVAAMNTKARAIGMRNTNFIDVTGVSKNNTTTLFDSARMMRYIKDYRSFIFNFSDKWIGAGDNGKETIFKVFKAKLSEEDNVPRFIFIGIADSQNAEADLENIILWLRNDLGLK